jgi:phytoene dehydrogenase-like protein
MACAALLAQRGCSVLVVEQHTAIGGYAHSYRRGPYTIDPAVHLIGDDGLFETLLNHLGVGDQCRFLKPETLYSAWLPGLKFHAPLGSPKEFVEAHVEALPGAADEIRSFFDLCARVHREAHELPAALGLGDVGDAAARFPAAFGHRRALLGDIVAEYLPDPQARALCSVGGLILGLPPSRLPFMGFAQLIFSYLTDGAFYCEGGADRLIEALRTAIERERGDIVLGTAVERIHVRDGKVQGVSVAGGSEIAATVVVSNAAARQTFETLVTPGAVPDSFLRTLAGLTPSISGLVLYAGTSAPLEESGLGHQTFSSRIVDLEAIYDGWLRGEPVALAVYVPTLVDSTLAPSGRHILTALAFRQYELATPWKVERERLQERVLDELDLALDGFRDTAEFIDCATPETLERFTLNTSGAIYGWENTLRHTGSKRPAQRSPVRGLYLAGHWTTPGAGFLRAAVSGIHAAQLIAVDRDIGTASEVFEYDRLPPAV